MKNKIKDFLFKKRIKILKSKRGFSLVEVLVAVAIIGIISAIAVPQFTANRNTAARVAGDTSISNILKAFNNCLVLNSFAQCNSLGALKVNCPDCQSVSPTGTRIFCAHISKGGTATTDPDFAACVSINASGNNHVITRSYGGTLLTGGVCQVEKIASTDSGPTCPGASKTAMSPPKSCTNTNAQTACGQDVQKGTTTCGYTYTCDGAKTGKCSPAGLCV